MRKLILLSLMFGLVGCAFGQEQSRAYSKWHLKPAAGINIPITDLMSGEITDNLLEYPNHAYYLQFISGSYFFSQNWGVEVAFRLNISRQVLGRADNFIGQIQHKYSDHYFVSPGYSPSNYDPITAIGVYPTGYIGLVYRIEKPQYIILPKVFIGVTSVGTSWGHAYLKEEGTHTILELSYSPENISNDHFIIAPGISFGYRLSKRFIASFDLVYSYYKTDFQFVEELRNTFTQETWSETIDYKKGIHSLSLGVGLIIELNLGNK